MLSSCMGRDGFVPVQCLIGILQLILTPGIIGWVWSIWWGCLIMSKSDNGGARGGDYRGV